MTDKTIYGQRTDNGTFVPIKAVDNGDGTYSISVVNSYSAPVTVSGLFYQNIQPTSDAGPAWITSRGLSGLPFTSSNQSASAAPVSDAPTTGQKLVVTDMVISVDTQMAVTFKEETSGTVVAGPYYMSANSTLQITPRGKFKLPTANKKLQVQTSVAGNITVSVYYYSEV